MEKLELIITKRTGGVPSKVVGWSNVP